MLSRMKRDWFVRIMALVAVVWGVIAFTWAFAPFHYPSRHSEDFLLSVSAFPGEWTAKRYDPGQLPGWRLEFEVSEADQGYVSHLRPNDASTVAIQYIDAFPSFGFAHYEYKRDIKAWFGADYTGREWTDVELRGNLLHADEYQQGCAISKKDISQYDEDTEVCVMVARYGQYVTVFRVKKDLAQLTYADVDMLFAEIDKNFSQ